MNVFEVMATLCMNACGGHIWCSIMAKCDILQLIISFIIISSGQQRISTLSMDDGVIDKQLRNAFCIIQKCTYLAFLSQSHFMHI